MKNARDLFKDTIRYAKTSTDCIRGAECCIVVTEWDEFRTIRAKSFLRHMREPRVLVDGRRMYDANSFLRAGIKFYAVGLHPLNPTSKEA
jgi:UDPglucose 6-dehydrogenase